MTYSRVGFTATLLLNGEVLVAGGVDNSGNGLNTCELYNPQTATWSPTRNMTEATLWCSHCDNGG